MQQTFPESYVSNTANRGNTMNSQQNQPMNTYSYLIALYILLVPMQFITLLEKTSITRIIGFAICLFLLIYLRKIKFFLNEITIYIVALLLYELIVLFYSYDVSASNFQIARLVGFVLFYLIVSYLPFEKRDIEFFKNTIVWSGWIVVVLFVFTAFGYEGTDRLSIGIGDASIDPNDMISYFILPVAFHLDRYLNKKNVLHLFLIILIILIVALSGSRGGLIAIICTLLMYTIFWFRNHSIFGISFIKLLFFVSVGIALFFLLPLFLPESVTNRFTISEIVNDNGSNRFLYWSTLLDVFQQSSSIRKLTGWGMGTIKYFNMYDRVAHNFWIEHLIEIGIIGVTIWVVIYVRSLQLLFKFKDYVMFSALIGFIVQGFSLSIPLHKPTWNLLFLIMLYLKLHYQETKLDEKNQVNMKKG